MEAKCGDKEVSRKRRPLRPASTVAEDIARRLDSIELFLHEQYSNSPSIPIAGQHTISPITPRQPTHNPSDHSRQSPQSLSATNSPAPSSSTAKDEPQSLSAATSEPPKSPPPSYSPIAEDVNQSSSSATTEPPPYSPTAKDEPQSSSAATSEPPKSPPDPVNQSSQSSPSPTKNSVPRLIGNSIPGRRYMNAADLGRFSRLLPSFPVEDRHDYRQQRRSGALTQYSRC